MRTLQYWYQEEFANKALAGSQEFFLEQLGYSAEESAGLNSAFTTLCYVWPLTISCTKMIGVPNTALPDLLPKPPDVQIPFLLCVSRLGGYVADAYWGRYHTIIAFTGFYLVGAGGPVAASC